MTQERRKEEDNRRLLEVFIVSWLKKKKNTNVNFLFYRLNQIILKSIQSNKHMRIIIEFLKTKSNRVGGISGK